jgi:limonene-1,2-epoxide hydrolase
MTPEALGRAWLDAFNAHDVQRLVSLYADGCTHTSPKIRLAYPETGGKLHGPAALFAWWSDALKRIPQLRYELVCLTANDERVVLEYLRHAPNEAPLLVAEAFDVKDGRIVASRVFHG